MLRTKERSTVYLSFDDGPDPRFTPRILDLLDSLEVCATFFVVGEACHHLPALLQRIHQRGHGLGNHSYSHVHPWLMGSRRARQEVSRAHHTISDIVGEAPRLFRPPYGRMRKCMHEEATSLGMETVLWNRSAIDWGMLAGIDSIARRLARTNAGDILLCHDARMKKNHPEMTLTVLPAFIEQCRNRGLRFASLNELLMSDDPAPPRPSLDAAESRKIGAGSPGLRFTASGLRS